ncbi:hypothetical protein PSHT_04853 [Puccinia striiformis]|uniref:Mitochondrial pyruvate carrier n=1 Tax=Puccinia striiformis TaxID=27350 RepID=A0A2S4WBZ2_9BASI|nr:hypothetical protein PSHT_04853 [Puccinia striiformis]
MSSLSATGLIWIRYSFVTQSQNINDYHIPFVHDQYNYNAKQQITPVNYSLASVNTFVAATGLAQLYRIWDYRRNNPTATAA